MNKIIDKINLSDNFVLLVHESPDGDAVGSIIAMYRTLKKLNKNVEAFIEKVPSNCEFLINSVGKEIKLFEEIDENKRYDVCISLDCGDKDRMGSAKVLFEKSGTTICIDHHYTNSGYAELNYIDGEASATGEILYDIISKIDNIMDKEIAMALYSAISSDTGNFRHNNTKKHTFDIAGNLIEYGIDVSKISYHLFSETSLNRMRFMGNLLQNVEIELNGKVGILTANQEDISKFNVNETELEGMVDFARDIKGTEVGIFIKPHNDMYKVSLRSNGNVDISGVAEKFNGGGHKFAAGCRFEGKTSEEVKLLLIRELEKIM